MQQTTKYTQQHGVFFFSFLFFKFHVSSSHTHAAILFSGFDFSCMCVPSLLYHALSFLYAHSSVVYFFFLILRNFIQTELSGIRTTKGGDTHHTFLSSYITATVLLKEGAGVEQVDDDGSISSAHPFFLGKISDETSEMHCLRDNNQKTRAETAAINNNGK